MPVPKMETWIPLVLRSRQHLRERGECFVVPGGVAPTELPITADGATYSMAQEIAWLDADRFAVGRWDGSLDVFAFNPSQSQGPLIKASVSNPSSVGVQMVQWLAPNVFVSSNDHGTLSVWRSADGSWTDLEQDAVLAYEPDLGVANSADSFRIGAALYLVVGHANGFVTIWSGTPSGAEFKWLTTVNLRSADPLNPWGLHNIRGVAWLGTSGNEGHVITGSENGNLCVVRVPDGAVLSTMVYNPAAERGINSVSVVGTRLLVANCSVGLDDANLWYYQIDPSDWSMALRDSANLKVSPTAPQVFNFCTIWGQYDQGLCWFASTEEGTLWMGSIADDESLAIFGYREVTSPLGSALAFNVRGRLAMISHNLYEFITHDGNPPAGSDNPERIIV